MSPLTIAALGSSFAAGPGIAPVENVTAGRSRMNYAHQFADRIGARLVDLTVSGATTANILDTPQETFDGTVFPAQLDGVPAGADFVTVTAGGNDLGFLGTMVCLALAKVDPESSILPMLRPLAGAGLALPLTSRVAEEAVAGLVSVVEGVQTAAPGARIVLVDYLTILDEVTSAGIAQWFTPAEVDQLMITQSTLRRVFEAAASQSGAELLRASTMSTGHALGSEEPWVQPLYPDPMRTMGSFHPNESGMAAIATELEHML